MKSIVELLPLLLVGSSLTTGCSSIEFRVHKVPHQRPNITTRKGFDLDNYGRILIVPPELQRQIPQNGIPLVKGKLQETKMISTIERILLSKGYTVISQDVIARVEKGLSSRKGDTATGATYTRSEKALILGKETNAQAIMVLDSLALNMKTDCYVYSDKRAGKRFEKVLEVDCSIPEGSKGCIGRIPYLHLDFQGKLIDVTSGEVLWIGATKVGSLSMLPEDWEAEVKKERSKGDDGEYSYRIKEQNYDISFYTELENLLDSDFYEKHVELALKLVLEDF